MIRTDMKKGERFTDGTETYEVLEVLEDGNYISKKIEGAVIEPEKVNIEVAVLPKVTAKPAVRKTTRTSKKK